MLSVCRNAWRTVLKNVRTTMIASTVIVDTPSTTAGASTAAVRALSNEAGWAGGRTPWSGHGGDGGRESVGWSERSPRRAVERRPGDW